MLDGIRKLPLDSLEAFTADAQTTAAAESYLRRSHDICANQLGDLEGVRDALLEWIRANPERIDRAI